MLMIIIKTFGILVFIVPSASQARTKQQQLPEPKLHVRQNPCGGGRLPSLRFHGLHYTTDVRCPWSIGIRKRGTGTLAHF
ncbi:hypothetical protein V8C26DRAFT_395182 [Trichoderma gracile]